jgi:hypothetical protein
MAIAPILKVNKPPAINSWRVRFHILDDQNQRQFIRLLFNVIVGISILRNPDTRGMSSPPGLFGSIHA